MIAQSAKIVLKSPREIELMRAAGKLVHDILDEVGTRTKPGVTTGELDQLVSERIAAAGAQALFRGVKNTEARFPFPASICASVNEAVVHGIPDNRPLHEGDIVKVDCGVRLKGYCGDSARTYVIGKASPKVQRLLHITQEALDIAVREIRPGIRWSRVAKLMQACVEDAGFGVVRNFVGHGIGREMHEEPKVPNYHDRDDKKVDFELLPGMTIAVEPMVTAGRPEVEFADRSKWTVVTKDRGWAAHFEHTIAVTRDGADVLTDGRPAKS